MSLEVPHEEIDEKRRVFLDGNEDVQEQLPVDFRRQTPYLFIANLPLHLTQDASEVSLLFLEWLFEDETNQFL